MKNYKLIILLLGIIILALNSCYQSTANESLIELMNAPEFTLTSTDGNEVSLSDFEGKFIVMHIATTWCPYCNAEAPYLEKLYNDYKDQDVAVIIIDVKEPNELVREKIKDKFNLSFPVLLDLNGSVAANLAPKEILPELARDEIMLASNLLIDPDGNIQYMSLLDTKNFDVELVHLKQKLNELL